VLCCRQSVIAFAERELLCPIEDMLAGPLNRIAPRDLERGDGHAKARRAGLFACVPPLPAAVCFGNVLVLDLSETVESARECGRR
jgi:hypothetical protein